MPYTITIGNQEVFGTSIRGRPSPIDPYSTIRAVRTMGPVGRGSMAFSLLSPVTAQAANLAIPDVGQEVIFTFTDPNNGNAVTTIFSGVLENVDISWVNPDTLRIDCSVSDYTRWLDREMVSGFFTDANGGTMVQTIISQSAPDINTTNVDTGIPIFPKAFDWVPPSTAIQQIAEDTGYVWWIDPVAITSGGTRRPQLFFKPRFDRPAPRILMRPDTDLDFGNLTITRDTSRIANRVIIKDFFFRSPSIFQEAGDDVAQDITFDGNTKVRLLRGVPYSIDDVTVTRTDTTPDIPYTVVSEREATSAGYREGFTPAAGVVPPNTVALNFDPPSIRFPPGNVPVNGNTFQISYRTLTKTSMPEIIADAYSIEYFRRIEGMGAVRGIYDEVLSLSNIEITGSTSADITQNVLTLANRILKRYAWPRISGKFEVYSDQIRGAVWLPGQWFDIFSDKWKLWDQEHFWKVELFNPGRGPKVALRVWITSVTYEIVTPDVMRYTIEFSSVPRRD